MRRSRGPTALGYFCRLGYGRGAAARRVLASGRFGRRGRLEMRLRPGGVWRILELDSREGARPCCGLDGLARGAAAAGISSLRWKGFGWRGGFLLCALLLG